MKTTGDFNLNELYDYIPQALEAVMQNAEDYIDASERTPYWTGATQESKEHEVRSKIAKLSYKAPKHFAEQDLTGWGYVPMRKALF